MKLLLFILGNLIVVKLSSIVRFSPFFTYNHLSTKSDREQNQLMWFGIVVVSVALLSTKVDVMNVASSLIGSIRDIIEFDGSSLMEGVVDI